MVEAKVKALVTGGKGQLARAFGRLFEEKGLRYVSLPREKLDVSDFNGVLSVVRTYRPEVIINCAAYNLVDQAEKEFSSAIRVNTLGAYNLALAAAEIGAFLIHFSTDYVFDGEKGDLYTETDSPAPVNKYGLSKWLGELAMAEVGGDYLIFRVSWLFGEGKQNFLSKVWHWAQNSETLHISYDEFSSPTHTETAARISWQAYEEGLKGLYHLASRGYCSRLEWAKFFLELKKCRRKIVPVSGASFGLPAKRPFFSALDSSKLEKALGIEMPLWWEEVKKFAEKTA